MRITQGASEMHKYLELLGFKVKDVVSGFSGVVTSISFDLYGCVQAVVSPEMKEGKIGESCWFDTKRLQATSDQPVMPVPTFEVVPGGQTLPQYESKPSLNIGHPDRAGELRG